MLCSAWFFSPHYFPVEEDSSSSWPRNCVNWKPFECLPAWENDNFCSGWHGMKKNKQTCVDKHCFDAALMRSVNYMCADENLIKNGQATLEWGSWCIVGHEKANCLISKRGLMLIRKRHKQKLMLSMIAITVSRNFNLSLPNSNINLNRIEEQKNMLNIDQSIPFN